MLSERKKREAIVQMLFAEEMASTIEDETLSLLMEELEVTRKNIEHIRLEVGKISLHREALDEKLRELSLSYSLERIQRVERSILRLALYELLYEKRLPPAIIISEAMRLVEKFGTKEAAAFINAILDNAIKESSLPSEATP